MVQEESLKVLYDECHKRFKYDNGKLIYRYTIHSKQKQGESPKKQPSNSYLMVTVNYKSYLVHRVIYLMHTGELPELLDHIDRDTYNNKIENLRPADKALNSWNRGLQANNSSGYRGVSWNVHAGKWHAYIKDKGKRLHIGLYDNVEEASKAYECKRFELRGDESFVPQQAEGAYGKDNSSPQEW